MTRTTSALATKSKYKGKGMDRIESMKIVQQILKEYRHTIKFLEKL